MRQAIISVDETDLDGLGLRDVTDCFRDAGIRDVEILSCDWQGGVCRIRVVDEADPDRLDAADAIDWWERVADGDDHRVYVLELRTPDPLDLPAVDANELLPAGFAEVTADGFRFDISGSQPAIAAVLEAYGEQDVDVALEGLRDYPGSGHALDTLTDRQRDALATAFDLGYYDVPRTATVEDVAAELGVDDSTACEHLQRAERNLIGTLLDGRD